MVMMVMMMMVMRIYQKKVSVHRFVNGASCDDHDGDDDDDDNEDISKRVSFTDE